MKKVCTKCGVEKELSEFCKAKLGKYGVGSSCKECRKQYYKENKENRENKENKERQAECIKEYRKENKEKIAKWQKEYDCKNKEKKNEQHRKYDRKRVQKCADAYVIAVLKTRFNLTNEEIEANPVLIELQRLSIENYRNHLKELKNGK